MSRHDDRGRLEELLAEAKRRGATLPRNRRAAVGGGVGVGLIAVLAVVFFVTRPTGSVVRGSGSLTPPAGPSAANSPTPVPTPSGSPAANDAGSGNSAGALAAFVAGTAGAGYASPIVSVDGAPTAVVEVTKATALEELDVVSLTQPSAALEASLSLTPTGGATTDYAFLSATHAAGQGALRIATGDFTGDGQPDFLVLLEAADNFPGVVVSNDGGSWRLVPTSASDPTMVYIGRNPTISGGHLTSTSCGGPACVPSITLTWTYVRSSGGYLTSS